MNEQNRKTGFYAWLLFLVWPFLAAITAFRNYDQKWAKNIFWGFCAFYGLVFAIGIESEGSDIVRYVAGLKALHVQQISYFEYSESVKSGIEVMMPIVNWTLSRFTDSQPVLTLVYGIIFGFFFSRNLWYVLERLKGNLLTITILLLICLFMVNPIWRINGFRFWTATHVFLYGLLPYLCEGKKKGLIICASAILVHFSFIVPVLVLFSYAVGGNRLTIYYGLFIITLFISEIDITYFNNIAEAYLPEAFLEQSESYRREGQVESFREAESEGQWYANWYGPALKWAIIGFLSMLFFKSGDFFEKNEDWLSLFSFTLLFYSVANLLSSIPSGGRFLVLANLCALTLIIFYIQNQSREKFMQWYIYGVTPALLLYIIVSLRIGLYSISASAIFGNPIIAYFTAGDNISLNDVMRALL
jgi:hypothetical protein